MQVLKLLVDNIFQVKFYFLFLYFMNKNKYLLIKSLRTGKCSTRMKTVCDSSISAYRRRFYCTFCPPSLQIMRNTQDIIYYTYRFHSTFYVIIFRHNGVLIGNNSIPTGVIRKYSYMHSTVCCIVTIIIASVHYYMCTKYIHMYIYIYIYIGWYRYIHEKLCVWVKKMSGTIIVKYVFIIQTELPLLPFPQSFPRPFIHTSPS